jgi:hypothetical protein
MRVSRRIVAELSPITLLQIEPIREKPDGAAEADYQTHRALKLAPDKL